MDLENCKSSECRALVLVTDENLGFCSKPCRYKANAINRKRFLKSNMFDYLGGKCKRCNNDDRRVLCFHHLDPLQKKFDVSTKWNLNYKKLKIELDKCVLLCRNCHAIIHFTRDPEYIKISKFCLSAEAPVMVSYRGLDKCTSDDSEVYKHSSHKVKAVLPRELKNYIIE